MAELELEGSNNAELQTKLIATPHVRRPNQLKGFVGNHILEVKPCVSLPRGVRDRRNPFGGVLARGVGFGVVGMCEDGGAGSGEPSGRLAGGRGNSAHGPGVFGAGEVGGQFKDTSAQLSLLPAASSGRPAVGFHTRGEIFLDAQASLFVGIEKGTPGTWLRVLTEPA